MRKIAIFLVLVAPILGCTTNALRRNTLTQIDTAVDLRYAEVLENLAMLDTNPDMVPAYTSVYAGTSKIDETAAITPSTIFINPAGNLGLIGVMKSLDAPVSRSITQTWTLDPVMVPEKLRAIRVACKWALLGYKPTDPDTILLSKYKAPTDLTAEVTSGFYFDVESALEQISPGWVKRSCRRKDVPKCAAYSASFGGHYAWVEPDDLDSFSAFCIVIQKIARVDLNHVILPRPSSSSITQDFSSVENSPYGKVTFSVFNSKGGELFPTDGSSTVLPVKSRLDNTGQNSDLKAVIAVSAAKSP